MIQNIPESYRSYVLEAMSEYGPLFNQLQMNPTNCQVQKSFVAPKVAAPLVAVVGGKDFEDLNPVLQKTVKYL